MYARHQAALAELTQSVLAHTSLALLMEHAATLVAETFAVMYSAIWECQPGSATPVLRAAVGWAEITPNGTTIEASATSVPAAATNTADPIVVADWPSETRFTQLPQLLNRNVLTSMAVVIPGASAAFGSLSVDVTASRLFSDEEIHFLQAVANVLALAAERAQPEHAIQEERQRLARELHDSVTQALYSVTLHAQGMRRLLAAGEHTLVAEALGRIQETAQEALDEMRVLIFELRPPVLEQVGLVAALQARLNSVEGRAGLHTRLIADEHITLPIKIEHALYRIAQEALNNVLKHAHARTVTAEIHQTQNRVRLEVSDNGAGFEAAAASENGGLGLRGIVERVAQLDGVFVIESAPQSGTTVRVEIEL